MLLNAQQISEAAQRWYQSRDTALDKAPDNGDITGAHAGDGPYHLLVAVNATTASYSRRARTVREVLTAFGGEPIPNLCQLFRVVRTDQMSLHVVPARVYELVEWDCDERFSLDATLTAPPFAAPPTEDDLAAVLVRAMSVHAAHRPGQFLGGQRLGRATARACARVGWRNVANLVDAMGERLRTSPDDLADVLEALTSNPAPPG